jgi:hypothetical protein
MKVKSAEETVRRIERATQPASYEDLVESQIAPKEQALVGFFKLPSRKRP